MGTFSRPRTALPAANRTGPGQHSWTKVKCTAWREANRYRDQDDSIGGGYYEHRLDAVRFGSQRWWKIYDEQLGSPR